MMVTEIMIKSTKSNFWVTVANLILRNRLLIINTILVTLFLASQWQNMRFTFTEANLLPRNIQKISNMKILSKYLEKRGT